MKLQRLLERALADADEVWAPIQQAYAWVHQAARLLTKEAGRTGREVQHRLSGLLGAMARWGAQASELAPTLAHFRKVTRSYWPGLFACYAVKDLPRTNNDLEHLFGSHRYTCTCSAGASVTSGGPPGAKALPRR